MLRVEMVGCKRKDDRVICVTNIRYLETQVGGTEFCDSMQAWLAAPRCLKLLTNDVIM